MTDLDTLGSPTSGRVGDLRDRVVARWTALASWQQVLVVYGLTRLYAAFLLLRAGDFQAESLWTKPDPSYLDMTDNWDGDWYRRIAEEGYPAQVPRDDAGRAYQNQWAFYPLFPLVARVLMTLTGGSWPAVASTLALLCGAAAVVLLHAVVAHVAGRSLALWTVVLVCCFPSAAVFQLTYTESVALLLLVGVLRCLQTGRYWLAVPLVLAVGVARPIGIPLAAVVGLHVLRPWLPARLGGTTGSGPSGGRPGSPVLVAQAALLAAAGAAAVSWTVISAAGTGEATAYTDTMAAWRSNGAVVPVRPWWWISQHMLGDRLGPVLLVVTVAAVAAWLAAPGARVIAGDLRVWSVAYLLYLLAVLDPGTSLPRYLLLAFPLGTLTAAVSTSRAYRAAVAVAFLLLQVVWVVWLWRFVPPSDWPP